MERAISTVTKLAPAERQLVDDLAQHLGCSVSAVLRIGVARLRDADRGELEARLRGLSSGHRARVEAARLRRRAVVVGALSADAPGERTFSDLASLAGTTNAKLWGILRELTEEGVLERSGRGVAGSPYRFRLVSRAR